MTTLSVLARTAFSATVMIDASRARYHLAQPVEWSLNGGEQSGVSTVVPLFLDGLTPSTDYTLRAGAHEVRFATLPCAGAIDAAAFGVAPGSADNAAAFAEAVAAVPHGGALIVPRGRHMTGPIFLKSDMTLHLPLGAEIATHGDRTDWPILPSHDAQGRVVGTWEGLPEPSFAAPLTAIGCDRLTITGGGILDGGGDRGDWWQWPKETRQDARRPRSLFLAHCTDVILSGLTVRNSPSWTVHPYRCQRLTAAALRIENPADSPNTDGFDPESCTDISLQGLRISVGDDCIAVKSGKRGTGTDRRTDHIAPTRHLTIANCLMQDGHGAVVMGSEMSGDITDVEITRCEFHGTDRGLRIKTRRGRGGEVARIALRDVTMHGVGTAIAVNAFYFCDADGKSDAVQSRAPAPVDESTPAIRDITVEDVTIASLRHAVAALLGLPEAPIQRVRLSRIAVDYDVNAVAGEVLMACRLPQIKHGGILHTFADIEVDAPLAPILKEFQDAV
ncbi:polygalacturonase PglA [Flavimaricola marinus]|uniref:Polygalacturonase n=1 Tax=Flavimaricola marinus TaxID=1819565 RepID=A0A238LFA1_9RHOB|nr:glycoside hydrolase family 28 protein [Flavimaricola marinus]SMY07580.1 Polygalacturonase [Flavimaricola marinus]